jgi:hypothetical protein
MKSIKILIGKPSHYARLQDIRTVIIPSISNVLSVGFNIEKALKSHLTSSTKSFFEILWTWLTNRLFRFTAIPKSWQTTQPTLFVETSNAPNSQRIKRTLQLFVFWVPLLLTWFILSQVTTIENTSVRPDWETRIVDTSTVHFGSYEQPRFSCGFRGFVRLPPNCDGLTIRKTGKTTPNCDFR